MELLPCPFCGANDVTLFEYKGQWVVECMTPDCCASDPSYGTPHKATLAWNRRTPPPNPDAPPAQRDGATGDSGDKGDE